MRRLLILLLFIAPIGTFAADQPLGRLFLTPAERTSLDLVRKNSKPPEKIIDPDDPEAAASAAENAPPVVPPVVTVHGFVKRSDGKGTVWVNGQPVEEKASTKGIEVGRMPGNTNQVPIRLPGTGQTVRLKAGQSFDPASGKMADSLRDLPPPQAAPVAVDAPTESKDTKVPDAAASGSSNLKTPPSPPAPSR